MRALEGGLRVNLKAVPEHNSQLSATNRILRAPGQPGAIHPAGMPIAETTQQTIGATS